ncbi:Uma2 family endonuclease [uncultured Thiohalocapsa sp.]|uniref:Uma2 family endonuclease n=1 Tax=uncultured Thiohalocapsa sp. TaxID=768990 RepID=UPI0025D0165F|nr:Uma2 family endonuclease [uncultured Thiohalocapsa sp.]
MATTAQDLMLRHRHRYTVDDYYRMADAGILSPDARVELIDGDVMEMPPIGPPHASMVTELQNRLMRAVGDAAVVRVQNPVRLGPHDEPEPDLAVVTPPLAKYRTRHPEPADILLLIEVADSSLALDRDVKLARYAACGIPEAWLVDAQAGTILRCHGPGPDGYRSSRALHGERTVPVPGLSDCLLDLANLG